MFVKNLLKNLASDMQSEKKLITIHILVVLASYIKAATKFNSAVYIKN